MSNSKQNICVRAFESLCKIRGLNPRPQQQEMIACGSVAFSTGRAAMIEAPTGVGKTIGYLIPGVASAIERKRRLIVSTATVALQEQLISKDLPSVIDAFRSIGHEINAVLLKGRGRYVCPLRMDMLASQGSLLDEGGTFAQKMDKAFHSGWNGERDSYPDPVQFHEWDAVKNDRHSCIGDRCKLISKCPYFLNTEAAKTATVVIANHDLVMSGVMRSPKSLFADFSNNLYAFDEGHHLPSKAASVFAATAPCDLDFMIPRIADVMRLSAAVKAQSSNAHMYITLASERVKLMGVKFDEMADGGSNVLRFSMGVLPEQIQLLAMEAAGALDALIQDCLKSAVSRLNAQGRSASSPDMLQLSTLIGEMSEIHESLISFYEEDEGKPEARWAEKVTGSAWSIKVSPFDAGAALRGMFWENATKNESGIVITSATLLPMGNADMALRAMGFADKGATVLMLSSPYADNYREKVRFIIPLMRFGPDEYRPHVNEVAFNIIKHFGSQGGMLCLFASSRQMRDVADLMPEKIRSVLLMQGELSYKAILNRHTRQIESGGLSVIFGLATFAEGVDLPGELCTKVVITKIPFPSPDEPLIAAACEWVEDRGVSSFATVVLPLAYRVLKQSIGRLVRTEEDYGEIVILDNRIKDKSYGKRLINGLGFPVKVDFG